VTEDVLFRPRIVAAIEEAVSRHCGSSWTCVAFVDLNDRASHPCGIFRGESSSVFAKLAPGPDGLDQLVTEVNSLRLLSHRGGIATPAPIGDGIIDVDGGHLLLFDAVDERPPAARTVDDWRSIGSTLATLHDVHDAQFGLEVDGYFGPLRQDNRRVPSNRWNDFYVQRRLLPNLRLAIDSGNLPVEHAAAVERLASRLDAVAGPEPVPSLLHGDAQQNNFISADKGAVAVDPSPCFGHPEIDLAMLDIFTEVPREVFDAYSDAHAIDPAFGERRELWRMFAYLAVIAVDGANPFGRQFVQRLADAVAQYA